LIGLLSFSHSHLLFFRQRGTAQTHCCVVVFLKIEGKKKSKMMKEACWIKY
jgi:hypothetical protein